MTPNVCVKCGTALTDADAICPQCTTTVRRAHSPASTIDLPDSPVESTDGTIAYSSSAPTPPVHIGRYEIRQKLGEGTFGIVYRAWDPQLQRDVALRSRNPHS